LDTGNGRVWQEGEVHADLVRVSVRRTFQDPILNHFRTPTDILSFGIFSLISQVSSINKRNVMRTLITFHRLAKSKPLASIC
jgi:hypothetical protein